MKVKVVRQFIDRHSKTLHRKGDEIEVTAERFEEINSTSRGAIVEKTEGVKESKEAQEAKEVKDKKKKPTTKKKK